MRISPLLCTLMACAGHHELQRDTSADPPATAPAPELAALQASMTLHSAAVDAEATALGSMATLLAEDRRRIAEMDTIVRQLDPIWRDIIDGYQAAAASYDAASRAFQKARAQLAESSNLFAQSQESWEQAEAAWWDAAIMIISAQAIEAFRLRSGTLPRKAEEVDLDCANIIPTSKYRRVHNTPSGVDIDHIVPRSLGGADHPSNYQPLPASVNRSLGNEFGPSKCRSAGPLNCAIAVAVSVKCGNYRGLINSL